MSSTDTTSTGILLYGPPAAGKDTVTAALTALGAFCQFQRLKVGSGKSAGYRMGTAEHLAVLEKDDGVVYSNERYGNVYVVDRPGLAQTFASGAVPVLHLGQVAGVEAVQARFSARWLTVLLWCSKETTARRSAGRGDADTAARLEAWDATLADLSTSPDFCWHVVIDTDRCSADAAAERIAAASQGAPPAMPLSYWMQEA
ncbi:hypothetical protein [Streptomyces sp. NRRL S-495]|uniref:hypothetical protein n=1 Tax=Streptomyces sp. NRRL S-495 TaxID=1609133 RepID=UPI0005F95855|nr:hypothetical protein [Streptomyces sp. NRRL S-495]KJY32146.1 guanylate kinase [Streptomyces sp. NRRL S-495]